MSEITLVYKPPCTHRWVPNDGRGGVPQFVGGQMWARCVGCDARALATPEQWDAIAQAQDGGAASDVSG